MKNPLLVKYPVLSMTMFVSGIIFLIIAMANRNSFTLSLSTWSISAVLLFLTYPLDKEVDM